MTRAHLGLRAVVFVCVIGLAGCGADTADETSAGGEAATGAAQTETRDVRACGVLDLAMASRLIGPGTEHPGGDTEQLTCMYVNPGVATLTLQLGRPELYDEITIMEPHTAVEIGERGRYHVEDSGAVAVQFVTDAHSATLVARPIGKPQSDYQQPAIAVARELADRLP